MGSRIAASQGSLITSNSHSVWNLPYDLRYLKLGIRRILEDLPSIEQNILDDVRISCGTFLENSGAQIAGELFIINGEQVKLLLDYVSSERKLLVKFLIVLKPERKVIRHIHHIDEFGAIRTVQIEYPYLVRKNFQKLGEAICDQIRSAYISLESLFISNFKSLGSHLFESLFSILNSQIELQNKSVLIGKTWFTVTVRSNMMFRYFFDQSRLDLVVDYLKANQVPEYSPMEMFITLIRDEAIHTLNTLVNTRVGAFDYIHANTYMSQDKDVRFWTSESLLVSNEEMACFTIIKTENLILQAGCKRIHESEFSEVFEKAKDSMAAMFAENIKRYLKHSKELTLIPRRSTEISLTQKIADISGTFSASFVYTLFKKLSK